MGKIISANKLNKKKEAGQEKTAGDFSADKFLADPAIKKVLIRKLMSMPETRQFIIKTIINKINLAS